MKRLWFLLALFPVTVSAMDKIAEVEHSTPSVILRFPLYDAASPADCASDVTISTSGLQINVSSDVTAGYYDQYQQSDSTLEDITTIGTYATPTATKARFKIIATGACTYELQLPDAAFAISNANVLTIEVTDGTTEILDAVYWVDLTPVSQTTFINSLLGTSCASPGAGTLEEQWCTDVDAILTDTGTTLDTRQQTIVTNTNYDITVSESADNGSTTTVIDSDSLAGSFADDVFNDRASIYVTFSTGVQSSCIKDYVDSTGTVTVHDAFSTAVTTEAFKIVADSSCNLLNTIVEDQGDTYSAAQVLSLLLSEGVGTCTYDSTARTWTCNDPGGNEQRFVITYGSGLDGTRTGSSTSPATP